MSTLHSAFLKEMGISEWTTREEQGTLSAVVEHLPASSAEKHFQESTHAVAQEASRFHWWFFGEPAQGDAQFLFQGILRALGIAKSEWTWLKPDERFDDLPGRSADLPIVAFAFGGPSTQKLTGERDPISQLRQTVLALSGSGNEEVPVVATFDLNYFLSKPKEKALLWEDLLLARSVLQSL